MNILPDKSEVTHQPYIFVGLGRSGHEYMSVEGTLHSAMECVMEDWGTKVVIEPLIALGDDAIGLRSFGFCVWENESERCSGAHPVAFLLKAERFLQTSGVLDK
jgi:hypothetical protein